MMRLYRSSFLYILLSTLPLIAARAQAPLPDLDPQRLQVENSADTTSLANASAHIDWERGFIETDGSAVSTDFRNTAEARTALLQQAHDLARKTMIESLPQLPLLGDLTLNTIRPYPSDPNAVLSKAYITAIEQIVTVTEEVTWGPAPDGRLQGEALIRLRLCFADNSPDCTLYAAPGPGLYKIMNLARVSPIVFRNAWRSRPRPEPLSESFEPIESGSDLAGALLSPPSELVILITAATFQPGLLIDIRTPDGRSIHTSSDRLTDNLYAQAIPYQYRLDDPDPENPPLVLTASSIQGSGQIILDPESWRTLQRLRNGSDSYFYSGRFRIRLP